MEVHGPRRFRRIDFLFTRHYVTRFLLSVLFFFFFNLHWENSRCFKKLRGIKANLTRYFTTAACTIKRRFTPPLLFVNQPLSHTLLIVFSKKTRFCALVKLHSALINAHATMLHTSNDPPTGRSSSTNGECPLAFLGAVM